MSKVWQKVFKFSDMIMIISYATTLKQAINFVNMEHWRDFISERIQDTLSILGLKLQI